MSKEDALRSMDKLRRAATANVEVPGVADTTKQERPKAGSRQAIKTYKTVDGSPFNVVTAKGNKITFVKGQYVAMTQDSVDCLDEFVESGHIEEVVKEEG